MFPELEERTGKKQGEISGWKREFFQKKRGKLFVISYSLCLELDLSSMVPIHNIINTFSKRASKYINRNAHEKNMMPK